MCVDRAGWGSVHTSHGTPGTHITLKGSLMGMPCLSGPLGVQHKLPDTRQHQRAWLGNNYFPTNGVSGSHVAKLLSNKGQQQF